jgi:hypothetical protein
MSRFTSDSPSMAVAISSNPRLAMAQNGGSAITAVTARKSPHGMTIMRMSSIKFLALAVLVIVVLLTLAEFGPAVLSGR